VLRAGVTAEALTDAVAVASLFNIITRYADALDFAIPTADEFDRAGNMLLKRGYWSLWMLRVWYVAAGLVGTENFDREKSRRYGFAPDHEGSIADKEQFGLALK
jgi:hypothetical protein